MHDRRLRTPRAQPLLRVQQQGPGAAPPYQDRFALGFPKHLGRLRVLFEIRFHLARPLLHHRLAGGGIGTHKAPFVVL